MFKNEIMEIKTRRAYEVNWVYGSEKDRASIIEDLFQRARWSNDGHDIIPDDVKKYVLWHIMKTNSEWGFNLYTGGLDIYLNGDCTPKLGVYGLHIGDIIFPPVEGITSEEYPGDPGYEEEYYGSAPYFNRFSLL